MFWTAKTKEVNDAILKNICRSNGKACGTMEEDKKEF